MAFKGCALLVFALVVCAAVAEGRELSYKRPRSNAYSLAHAYAKGGPYDKTTTKTYGAAYTNDYKKVAAAYSGSHAQLEQKRGRFSKTTSAKATAGAVAKGGSSTTAYTKTGAYATKYGSVAHSTSYASSKGRRLSYY